MDCLHAAWDYLNDMYDTGYRYAHDVTNHSHDVLVALLPQPQLPPGDLIVKFLRQQQLGISTPGAIGDMYGLNDMRFASKICDITGQTSGPVREFAMSNDGMRLVVGSIAKEDADYNRPGNLVMVKFDSRDMATLEHTTPFESRQANAPEISLHSSISDVLICDSSGTIAVGSTDTSVRFYSLEEGYFIYRCDKHTGSISRMCKSLEHDWWIASVDDDGAIFLHDIRCEEESRSTPRLIRSWEVTSHLKGLINDVTFGHSATTNTLYSCVNRHAGKPTQAVQWDLVAMERTNDHFRLSKVDIAAINLNYDGTRLVLGTYHCNDKGGDGILHVLDARTMCETHTFNSGHDDVNVVTFSPCGTYVSSSCVDNETVIFDSRFGRSPLGRYRHNRDPSEIGHDGVTCISWLNGNLFGTGGTDGCVRIWNVKYAQEDSQVHLIDNHNGHVMAFTPTSDLKTFAIGYEMGFTVYSSDVRFDDCRDLGVALPLVDDLPPIASPLPQPPVQPAPPPTIQFEISIEI
ncbi:hypothetical protein RI367_005973 [Sorochytrium milnesiophthora]